MQTEKVDLEALVEYFINGEKADIKGDSYFYKAVKERFISDIKEEIKVEYKEEMKKNAEEEREKIRLINKIKDFKALFFSGIIIAFIVGLLVNQVTDIISIFKGALNAKFLIYSVGYSFIIAVVLYLIIKFSLLSEILKIIKKFTEKKTP